MKSISASPQVPTRNEHRFGAMARPEGAACRRMGRIIGTYLHGLFTTDAFREVFLGSLHRRPAAQPEAFATARKSKPASRLWRIMSESISTPHDCSKSHGRESESSSFRASLRRQCVDERRRRWAAADATRRRRRKGAVSGVTASASAGCVSSADPLSTARAESSSSRRKSGGDDTMVSSRTTPPRFKPQRILMQHETRYGGESRRRGNPMPAPIRADNRPGCCARAARYSLSAPAHRRFPRSRFRRDPRDRGASPTSLICSRP